jgi:hypothetical protein
LVILLAANTLLDLHERQLDSAGQHDPSRQAMRRKIMSQ